MPNYDAVEYALVHGTLADACRVAAARAELIAAEGYTAPESRDAAMTAAAVDASTVRPVKGGR